MFSLFFYPCFRNNYHAKVTKNFQKKHKKMIFFDFFSKARCGIKKSCIFAASKNGTLAQLV